jgi:hypothetical protein
MNVELQKFSAYFARLCDLCVPFLELRTRGTQSPQRRRKGRKVFVSKYDIT